MQYILDGKVIHNETLEIDNTRFEQQRSFTIPDNLSREKHYLQLMLIDNYGFRKGSDDEEKGFYVMDRPIIEEVGLDNPYLLQSEVSNIVGFFNDMDQGKIIYLFVQVGQKPVTEPAKSFQSNFHICY